jgi:hypothetical protein
LRRGGQWKEDDSEQQPELPPATDTRDSTEPMPW